MGEIKIRKAKLSDFKALYEIGKNTPELSVSSTEDFMSPGEFKWAITSAKGSFLLAQLKNKIVGFVYAHAKDLDRPFEDKYACLVYLVVVPELRNKGIAKKLYLECEKQIKKLGIKFIYCWANAEKKNSKIISLMVGQGLKKGHRYVWMDKKL